jgi:hypothetical protein
MNNSTLTKGVAKRAGRKTPARRRLEPARAEGAGTPATYGSKPALADKLQFGEVLQCTNEALCREVDSGLPLSYNSEAFTTPIAG